MIVIAGTVRIDPSRLNVARFEMEKMLEASRREDGCIEYSYAVDVIDSGLVRIFEVWRDKAALDRHFQAPHLASWRLAWPAIGISDRKLSIYDVSAVAPL